MRLIYLEMLLKKNKKNQQKKIIIKNIKISEIVNVIDEQEEFSIISNYIANEIEKLLHTWLYDWIVATEDKKNA